jgi:hypothetical protein
VGTEKGNNISVHKILKNASIHNILKSIRLQMPEMLLQNRNMVLSSRVKQGSVLSPLLFNSVMVAVTTVSGKWKRIVKNYKNSFFR